MKEKIIIPILMASPALFAQEEQVLFHQVVKGESFSGIVQAYSKQQNHYSFKELYKRFKNLNAKILNFNKIEVGQMIRIPSLSKTDVTKYQIQKGDTLLELSKALYPLQNPWLGLQQITNINPQIKDIDLIYTGHFLFIPKERASLIAQTGFKSYKELEDEIFSLSRFDASAYVREFKVLVASVNRKGILKGLKKSLHISRKQEKGQIEYAMLKLISLTFLNRKEDSYLDDIRNFFETWKRIRKSKHQGEEKA